MNQEIQANVHTNISFNKQALQNSNSNNIFLQRSTAVPGLLLLLSCTTLLLILFIRCSADYCYSRPKEPCIKLGLRSDVSSHRCKGWQDGNAAFHQNALNTYYYCYYSYSSSSSYYYFLPSVHMIPRGFKKLLENSENRYEQSIGAVISR